MLETRLNQRWLQQHTFKPTQGGIRLAAANLSGLDAAVSPRLAGLRAGASFGGCMGYVLLGGFDARGWTLPDGGDYPAGVAGDESVISVNGAEPGIEGQIQPISSIDGTFTTANTRKFSRSRTRWVCI
jgi:hypothetical protein